jgi:ABC-2 type transport system permease protein
MEATMLRLLWQEIVFRRGALIGWGLGLCFFPVVYLGIYPQVADEMQGLADLELYQALGINLGGLEDWIGSTIIMFVPLLASIYALINGTGTLAGEEEDGRLEMVITLPIPRWQVLAVKALALSIVLFVILFFVSLVSAGVLQSIKSQVETEVTAADLIPALLAAYPLPFAFAMLSLFLAAFCPNRRTAALISTAVVIVSYFGSNLANTVSALEPLKPLLLYSYLDTTANGVVNGQQPGDTLILLAAGLVFFGLALFFFQRRDITVGAWPWQRPEPA